VASKLKPQPEQDRLISVVMPVHNAQPHLDEAVRSILNQTHQNFEFVIFDDGSTDGSTDRLKEWAATDSRIKLVKNETNLGPAVSSNRVVSEATSDIIARMDADDISHQDRLRQQLEILRRRPDVGLVGTLCEIIDTNGEKLRHPEAWRLTRSSWFPPFPHGSIMYRRDIFEHIGGYREECEFWEDQDFAIRFSAQAKIFVVPYSLYQHRQSTTSTRVASDRARVERAVDLMYRCLDRMRDNLPYDDLVYSSESKAQPVDPRVFISIGSLVLWSGGRPRFFRRLLRRANLGANLRSLNAIIWTAWASMSPATLRLFLRAVVAARAALGRTKLGDRTEAVPWSPPAQYPATGAHEQACSKQSIYRKQR
jgi:glycosyltransferase involved in cell wall biosynthesis